MKTKSDPQLRRDINDLQEKLKVERKRVVELESQPPKEVVKEIIKEVSSVEVRRVEVPVIKYVKCPKQAAIIKELRAKLAAK
jgi:hypothetical protein